MLDLHHSWVEPEVVSEMWLQAIVSGWPWFPQDTGHLLTLVGGWFYICHEPQFYTGIIKMTDGILWGSGNGHFDITVVK